VLRDRRLPTPVVSNLIANAAKFTSVGGGDLAAAPVERKDARRESPERRAKGAALKTG
jgi:hypothetical protein